MIDQNSAVPAKPIAATTGDSRRVSLLPSVKTRPRAIRVPMRLTRPQNNGASGETRRLDHQLPAGEIDR